MLPGCIANGTNSMITPMCPRLLLVLAVMLTACAEFQSRENTTYSAYSTDGAGVNDWLSEMHATHAMAPKQLQHMLSYLETEFKRKPGPGNCLRLALLLAAGDEPVRDRDRAMVLLNEKCPGQYTNSEKELAAILRQLLGELDESGKIIGDMSNRIMKMNQRIEELEQQQRELTNIEQTIQHRENMPGQENDE